MAISSPRASARQATWVPLSWGGRLPEWVRIIAEAVSNILDGKINSVGSVTLTANQATSTLSDRRIGPDSVILFMPTTANAAAEIGNGTLYVSARTDESAVLTHANSAQSDRTYGYAILG